MQNFKVLQYCHYVFIFMERNNGLKNEAELTQQDFSANYPLTYMFWHSPTNPQIGLCPGRFFSLCVNQRLRTKHRSQ